MTPRDDNQKEHVMRPLLIAVAIGLLACLPAPAGEAKQPDPKLLNLVESGSGFLKDGKLEEGGNTFLDAMKQFPDSDLPVLGILKTSRMYVEKKETGEAIKWLDRGVEVCTRKAELHIAAATIYIEAKNNSEALVRARKAVEADPESIRIISNALTCMAAIEKFDDESKQLAERLQALQPRPVDAFLFLGFWHEKNNDPQTALDYYLKAVNLDTNYMQSRLMLGKLYEKSGKADLAEREYLKMTNIAPSHYSGFLCLAELYDKQGKKDAAKDYAAEAARLRQAAEGDLKNLKAGEEER